MHIWREVHPVLGVSALCIVLLPVCSYQWVKLMDATRLL